MPEHTPTPWQVKPGQQIKTLIVAENGTPVADTFTFEHSFLKKSREYHEEAADAEFIVKAVNAYDELTRLLGRIVEDYTHGRTWIISQHVEEAERFLIEIGER